MASVIAFAKRSHQFPSNNKNNINNNKTNASPSAASQKNSSSKSVVENRHQQQQQQFISSSAQLLLSASPTSTSTNNYQPPVPLDYKEKPGHIVIPKDIGLPGTAPSLLLIFFEESLVTPKERKCARDEEGRTLLHLSCLKAAPLSFIEELIVEHKIDVDVIDYAGNTPLHYSAQVKAHEHTKLLLRHGADGTLMNGAGDVPDVSFLVRDASSPAATSSSPKANALLSPSFSSSSAFGASSLSPLKNTSTSHRGFLSSSNSGNFSPNFNQSPLGATLLMQQQQQHNWKQQQKPLKELLAKCDDPPHYVPELLISARVSLFAAPPDLPPMIDDDVEKNSKNNRNIVPQEEIEDEHQRKERQNHAALIAEAARVARMEIAVPLVPLPWNAPPSSCITNFDNLNSPRNRRRSSVAAAKALLEQFQGHQFGVTTKHSSPSSTPRPTSPQETVIHPKQINNNTTTNSMTIVLSPALKSASRPTSSTSPSNNNKHVAFPKVDEVSNNNNNNNNTNSSNTTATKSKPPPVPTTSNSTTTSLQLCLPKAYQKPPPQHPLQSKSNIIMKKAFGVSTDRENSMDLDSSLDESTNAHAFNEFERALHMKNKNNTNSSEQEITEKVDDDEEEENEDIFAKSKKYYKLLEKNKKQYSLFSLGSPRSSGSSSPTGGGRGFARSGSDGGDDDDESKRRRRSSVVLHALPVWFAVIPRVSEMELQSGFLVGGMVRFHGEFQFDGMPFALAEIQVYEEVFCARFTSTLSAVAQNLHNNLAVLNVSGSLHLDDDEDPIVLELFTSTKDTSMPTIVRCFRDTTGIIATLEKKRQLQREVALLRRKEIIAKKMAANSSNAASNYHRGENDEKLMHASVLVQTTEGKAAMLLKRFMRRLLFLGKFQAIISLLATKALLVKRFLRRCVYRSKFVKAILFYVAASFFRYAMYELEKFSDRSSSGPYKAIGKVVRNYVETFTDQRFVTRSLLYGAVDHAYKTRQRKLMAVIKKHRNLLFAPRQQNQQQQRSTTSENNTNQQFHNSPTPSVSSFHSFIPFVTLEHLIPNHRDRTPWCVSLEEIINFSIQPMSRKELTPVILVAEQRDGGMMPRSLLYQIRQLPHSREMFEEMSRNKVRSTLMDLVTCFRGRKNYFEDRVMKWDKILSSAASSVPVLSSASNQNRKFPTRKEETENSLFKFNNNDQEQEQQKNNLGISNNNSNNNTIRRQEQHLLYSSTNNRYRRDQHINTENDDDNADADDDDDKNDQNEISKIIETQKATLAGSMMKGASTMRLIDLFSPVGSNKIMQTHHHNDDDLLHLHSLLPLASTARPSTSTTNWKFALPPWINSEKLKATDISYHHRPRSTSDKNIAKGNKMTPKPPKTAAVSSRPTTEKTMMQKEQVEEEKSTLQQQQHPSFLLSQQSTKNEKFPTIPLGKRRKN